MIILSVRNHTGTNLLDFFLTLQAQEIAENNGNRLYVKMPITSYVIKNALFWILSGKLVSSNM